MPESDAFPHKTAEWYRLSGGKILSATIRMKIFSTSAIKRRSFSNKFVFSILKKLCYDFIYY